MKDLQNEILELEDKVYLLIDENEQKRDEPPSWLKKNEINLYDMKMDQLARDLQTLGLTTSVSQAVLLKLIPLFYTDAKEGKHFDIPSTSWFNIRRRMNHGHNTPIGVHPITAIDDDDDDDDDKNNDDNNSDA
jgi:hypothetical protein